MAKLRQGILGGISGKVGSVVGGDWKGIPYIRTMVIPANPNTIPQQIVRSKMRFITSIGKTVINTVVQKFWDKFAIKMSGFNAFVKANMLTELDIHSPSLFVFSKGGLEGLIRLTHDYNPATGLVLITWNPATLSNGLPSDKVVSVLYDLQNKMTFVSDVGTLRSAGTISFNIGTGRTPEYMGYYLFAYRMIDLEISLVSDTSGIYST